MSGLLISAKILSEQRWTIGFRREKMHLEFGF